MIHRSRILPWAVFLSIVAHAAVFAGISVKARREARLTEIIHRIQLIEETCPERSRREGGTEQIKQKEPAKPKPRRKRTQPRRKVVRKRPRPVLTRTAVVRRQVALAAPVKMEKPIEREEVAAPSAPAEAESDEYKSRQVASLAGGGSMLSLGTGRPATGRTNTDWKKAYRRKIYSKIRRAKKYPYAARRAHMEGRVVISFTVSSSGRLASVKIVKNSPFAVLNSDAPAWVRRAAPFPPFPPEADSSSMTFTYGLTYDLKD